MVYQDRCEAGPELARVALADPARSDNRQRLNLPIPADGGEHDLCFIFTGARAGRCTPSTR